MAVMGDDWFLLNCALGPGRAGAETSGCSCTTSRSNEAISRQLDTRGWMSREAEPIGIKSYISMQININTGVNATPKDAPSDHFPSVPLENQTPTMLHSAHL
jgi:hypothetical protein